MGRYNTDHRILPESRLWEKLNCAGFAISRLRELELAQFGLSIEQSSVLRIILDHGGQTTVQEIMDKTMRQSNSVYMLINRMHKMGLITKLKKGGDKKNHIAITREGKSVFRKVTAASPQMVFSTLTAKEKVKLAELFDVLVSRARHLLGIPYRPPIIRYLDNGTSTEPAVKNSNNYRATPDTTLWSILNGTRFVISKVREIELVRFGLSIEQSSILYILSDHGGQMTIKEIVDKTMRQPNSVYTLTNRMQKMGLILKTKKAGDKEHQIAITEEGKNLFRKVTTASLEMVFSPLTSRDRVQLAKLCDVLINRARDLLGLTYIPPIVQYLQNGRLV